MSEWLGFPTNVNYDPGMAPDDDVDRLLDALVRSTFEVTAVLTRLAGENDLSLTQLRVLGILRDRRLRVTDLAAYLGVDKSSMSGLVDRAERRGLLLRERGAADGRVVEVVLAPQGAELLARLSDEARRALAVPLDGLWPADRARLAALLESFLDAFPASSGGRRAAAEDSPDGGRRPEGPASAG
jgi:DNA-binding MarR family transcriptional regulator